MSALSNAIRYFTNPNLFFADLGFSALVDYVTPDLPTAPGTGNPLQQGDINANTARKGSVVPEWWGYRRRYPDKICATRTFFATERVQQSHNALCLGAGEYIIATDGLRIGNTPIDRFGESAEYDVYTPGADVSADERFDFWYNAPEVGATTGSAGLDLAATQQSGSVVTATAATFSGKTVTFSLDVDIPESWTIGTEFEMKVPKDAVITDDGTRLVFTGDWQDVQPFVGMVCTLSRDEDEFQVIVSSYTDNGGTNDVLKFNTILLAPFSSSYLPTGSYRVSVGYANGGFVATAVTVNSISFDRIDGSGVVDATWTGFTTRAITDFSVTSDEAEGTEWIGPYPAVPEGETTDTLEIDFYFPRGLVGIRKDDGGKRQIELDVTVEYRVAGSSDPWTSVSYNFSDKTLDAIGFTRTIDLGLQMRPEVRFKRDTPEEDTSEKTMYWKCQVLRMKAKLPYSKSSYDGVTLLGVTTRTGERIAQVTDNQINVLATRKVDGIAANTISGLVYHIADSVGLPASQIDSTAIDALESTYWTPRGETFDYIFDKQGTVEDALNIALSAGMSSRVDKLGKVSAAREGIKAANGSGAITPHHMLTDLSVSFPLNQADVYNGVDVKYVSPTTWEEETVKCRIDGITATRVEEITVDGVTDKTRAWRIGMRRLTKNLAQQYTISGSTEMEARNFSPLDRITVTDDIPGFTGISAEIYGFSDDGTQSVLTVREDLEVSSYTNPRVIVINHSGERSATITPLSLTDNSVTIDSGLIGFVPVTDGSIDRATLMLCESTQIGYDIIVSGITPTSLTETSFTGVEYSDDYYAYDDLAPEA